MATTTLLSGTISSLITTGLNALANNALAISSAYSAGGGYVMAEVELVWLQAVAPTANTAFALWFIRAIDGTNYEDGNDGTTTPGRAPDVVFPVRAVNSTQRVTRRVLLPPGTFKALLKNDATGQALAATNNTLKILVYTFSSA